jgi:cyclic pyranopterin phosphate synthase
MSGGPLIDTFGRLHDSLRISLTDRCNIRCFYCMPEEGVKFGPRDAILTFEEIHRVARVAAGLGVRKIRLTGGEPLLRRDLPDLVRRLASIEAIEDLAMTTNGIPLALHARSLHEAGLRRLNVHLDTLDRQRFIRITRRDQLSDVLEGLEAAKGAGFNIKINAVAVKNLVEPDVVPLAQFGREHGFEIRYIEVMPLDAQHLWDRGKVLTAAEIISTISREVCPLEPVPDPDPRAPAAEYRYADGNGRVGIIASVTRPFCLNCNRIRLTADGKLRYCLFAIEETDVRGLLRGGGTDEDLARTIRENVHSKWLGHEINSSRFVPPPRPMYSIGG